MFDIYRSSYVSLDASGYLGSRMKSSLIERADSRVTIYRAIQGSRVAWIFELSRDSEAFGYLGSRMKSSLIERVDSRTSIYRAIQRSRVAWVFELSRDFEPLRGNIQAGAELFENILFARIY